MKTVGEGAGHLKLRAYVVLGVYRGVCGRIGVDIVNLRTSSLLAESKDSDEAPEALTTNRGKQRAHLALNLVPA